VPDITLRRCTVRVVRRGGWSWGREPRQLVNDVVRALPALLAAELRRHLPADADGEISAPLRIDVKIGLRELRAWARSAATRSESGAETADASEVAEIPAAHDAIDEAVRHAVGAIGLAQRLSVSKPIASVAALTTCEPEPHERAAVLLDVLKTWRAAGALESMLRALPEAAVIAWHHVLFEALPQDVVANAEATAATGAAVPVRLVERAIDAQPLECMRLRLQAAGELAAAAEAAPEPRAIRRAVEAAIHVKPDDGFKRRVVIVALDAHAAVRAPPGFETRVSNALPFLLLGPLHRIGWLDVLHATLSGAKLDRVLPNLAVALATRVLPEPERGWRRTIAATHSAAVFAGDAEPRPDSELASLARVAAPLMPALDAVVTRSLLDGRTRGDTLLLCAVGEGYLAVDPPGTFLVAHAEQAEALAALVLDAQAPVFVPEEDADTKLLASLDDAGVTFVTPARPVRGEHWTAIAGTHAPRLYSNRPVQRIVPPPESTADRARDTWRAFENRPLPGRPAERAFDRSLSLAAALALGTIAWDLWRAREPTDPLLALERFGDIDASVRFDEHRVRVRLPMGKRYRDLKEAGLLEDIPRVPWLDFRTVVFAGG
jgi:hypothetical protein